MRIVRETLIDLNRNEGVTILISSHILGELVPVARPETGYAGQPH